MYISLSVVLIIDTGPKTRIKMLIEYSGVYFQNEPGCSETLSLSWGEQQL